MTVAEKPEVKTKINYRPFSDRVVVEWVEAEDVTAGGIILPDIAQEKPQKGRVVAIGPGKIDSNGIRHPIDLELGEVVHVAKYSGIELKLKEKTYHVLTERDILGAIPN